MSAPVTPSDFSDLIPSPTASVCERIKNTLVVLPSRLYELVNWFLDAYGNLSDEFKLIVSQVTMTAGDMKHSFTNNQPSGWLLCDGTAYSRTTYATLFANIGTTFGVGDGVNTFNVPDCRGRVIVGAGPGTDLTPRTLGDEFGAETVSVSAAELAHWHGFGNGVTGDDAYFTCRSWSSAGYTMDHTHYIAGNSGHGTNSDPAISSGSLGTTNPYVDDTASPEGHENCQPSIVGYVYIWSGVIS